VICTLQKYKILIEKSNLFPFSFSRTASFLSFTLLVVSNNWLKGVGEKEGKMT
jgi:hypothetical protein